MNILIKDVCNQNGNLNQVHTKLRSICNFGVIIPQKNMYDWQKVKYVNSTNLPPVSNKLKIVKEFCKSRNMIPTIM